MTKQIDEPKTVWILGAGFSKPAGMPLATELLPLLIKRLGVTDDDDMSGWLHSLAARMRWLQYCDEAAGLRINIEQIFHYACFDALTHKLRQHVCKVGRGDGPDTPSNQAEAIESWLSWAEYSLVDVVVKKEGKSRLSKLKSWASAVRHADSILTFNYDTLAERALERAKKSWNHGTVLDADRRTGIPVFKLHGSVDWNIADRTKNLSKCDLLFDKPNLNRRKNRRRTTHVEEDCRLWRFRSRKQMSDWLSGRDLQSQSPKAWLQRPALAGLGPHKELHAVPGLGEVWIRAMQAVHQANRIVVIGFQMSDFDAMAQLQFAASMMKRHEGRRSPRMTVIDPGASDPAFSQRFLRVFGDVRFIPERHEGLDWSRL